MKRSTYQMHSEKDTVQFGRKLAKLLRPGDVIGLMGDLGAGKTFLSHAICRALDVPEEEPVNSPTFTLINEYTGGRMRIYHMDLYRLGDAHELYDLGIWEYYSGDGLCIVEWCDKFDDLWPEEALMLSIQLGEGETRVIEASGNGRGAEIIDELGD